MIQTKGDERVLFFHKGHDSDEKHGKNKRERREECDA